MTKCTAVEWILRKICRNNSLMIIQLLPRFTKLHRSFLPVRPSFKGIWIQLLELKLINELIWNWHSKSGTPKALEIIKQPDERVWRMKTLKRKQPNNDWMQSSCQKNTLFRTCFEVSNFVSNMNDSSHSDSDNVNYFIYEPIHIW